MSSELGQFLGEICPECQAPGYQRHLSAVGGCRTCADNDSRPVRIPMRNEHAGVVTYDMVLPKWPQGELWTPFRNRIPRATSCYRISAGMVHVQPSCRC